MDNDPEGPSELADAWGRIESAKHKYAALEDELDQFMYQYFKGMIRSRDPQTGDFAIQLRRPSDSIVSGRPKVLVGEILEGLRAALDYTVFAMSKHNHPNLNEKLPQFVIANSKSNFKRLAGSALKYLNDEQTAFIEQVQPYRGNLLLGVMGKFAGSTKHRHLLEIVESTSFSMHLDTLANRSKYEGAWVYPQDDHAYFVKPKGPTVVRLMRKYDAMRFLKTMIEHVADIVRASYRYFR